MIKLNPKIERIPASSTLKLNSLAKKMKAEGKDVINLTAGEPDLPTPTYIIEKTKDTLDQGETRYAPVPGLAKLRDAIAENSSTEYGHSFSADNVLVSNGAKQSLYNLFQAILCDGDEVILPAPYWVSYPHMITLAGGSIVKLPTSIEQNFVIDAKELATKITPRTKAIVINSPSNPTGAVQPRENLQEVVNLVKDKDIALIFDDIYQHITFDGTPWTSVFSLNNVDPERVFIVNGVSKSDAMTGFRIGWLIGPNAVIATLGRFQGHSTSGAATPSQWAAHTALTEQNKSRGAMCKTYQKRRDLIRDQLSNIDGVKLSVIGGTFYAFPDFSHFIGSKWSTSADLASFLLEEALVATVPGEGFGAPGHLRLSFAAADNDIAEGIKRIASALR